MKYPKDAQIFPNTDFLVVPKPTRIDHDTLLKYGDIYITAQYTVGGCKSWMTASDNREIIYATLDPHLIGCYFYRSFAGTGGKEQFKWFPVGGVYSGGDGSTMSTIWIIKGSPTSDPYFGRLGLGRLMERVNASMPHSDADVDALAKKLGAELGGWSADESNATIPLIIDTKTKLMDRSKLGYVLNIWKEKVLTKSFGQRNQDMTAQLDAVNPNVYYMKQQALPNSVSRRRRRSAMREGMTLSGGTSWPVHDEKHALIALRYMAMGRGDTSQYSKYLKKLFQLYPKSDYPKVNRLYKQLRDEIESW